MQLEDAHAKSLQALAALASNVFVTLFHVGDAVDKRTDLGHLFASAEVLHRVAH